MTLLQQAKDATSKTPPVGRKNKSAKKSKVEEVSIAYDQRAVELKGVFDVKKMAQAKRELLIRLRDTPQLLLATTQSLIDVAIESVEMGLSLKKEVGHVYIVQEEDRAYSIRSYAGYLELLQNSGKLRSFTMEVIRENDTFEYSVSDDGVKFNFIKEKHKDRGEKVGVFMFVEMINQGSHFGHIYKEELEAIRAIATKEAEERFWTPHTDTMYKITLIKRELKFLPIAPLAFGRLVEEWERERNENVISVDEVNED